MFMRNLATLAIFGRAAVLRRCGRGSGAPIGCGACDEALAGGIEYSRHDNTSRSRFSEPSAEVCTFVSCHRHCGCSGSETPGQIWFLDCCLDRWGGEQRQHDRRCSAIDHARPTYTPDRSVAVVLAPMSSALSNSRVKHFLGCCNIANYAH